MNTGNEPLTIVSYATQNPERYAELREGIAALMGGHPHKLVLARDEAEACAALREAEILLSWSLTDALLLSAPRLKWVHLGVAGVERSLTPAFVESNVVMTNSRGVHAPMMAEWTLAVLFYILQRMNEAEAWRRDRQWKLHKDDMTQTRRLLSGLRALMIGYGAIGKEIANRLSAIGVTCEAVARTPQPASFPVHTAAALFSIIGKFDIVVVALPLTRETDGLISRAILERMKLGSILVNLARGRLIDESALIDVLKDGPLGHAALDVFQAEPLPENSPIFDLPNVVMTPHVAGNFPDYSKMVVRAFLRNLERFLNGDLLGNVVDKQRGY